MKKLKKIPHLSLVASVSAEGSEAKPTNFWTRDVWTASDLGLSVHPGSGESRLYFGKIKQNWLKELTKKVVFIRAASVKFSTVTHSLKALKTLSYFLAEYYPTISEVNQIDEAVLTEYFSDIQWGLG